MKYIKSLAGDRWRWLLTVFQLLKQPFRDGNVILTVAFLMLLLNLMVLAVEWESLRDERQAAFAAAGNEAERAATALAGMSAALLQKGDLVIKMTTPLYLRSRAGGQSIDREQIGAMLEAIHPRGECGLCAFGIVDETGRRVLDWGDDPPARELLFGELRGSAVDAQEQRMLPVAGNGVLLLRRLRFPSGAAAGIAYARLDLAHLRTAMAVGTLGEAGGACLFAHDGGASVMRVAGTCIDSTVPKLLAEGGIQPGVQVGMTSVAREALPAGADEGVLAWHAVASYPLLAAVLLVDHDYLAAWQAKRAATWRYLLLIAALSCLPVLAVFLRKRRHLSRMMVSARLDPETVAPATVAELRGLPMLRRELEEKIELARQRDKLLAVCHLNIDDFSAINERHGRQFGDRLLIGVGDAIRHQLRQEDVVAHIGSDDFILVYFPLDDLAGCERAIDRLLASFAAPIRVGDVALTVSPSIGVSIFPRDDSDVATLLRHADRAMYTAKHAGGNRFAFFDTVAYSQDKSRRQIFAQVRRGIERREFRLHYQPKVDSERGVVVGFEALIRWQHPEAGLLSPAHFLPLIEDDDLIVELGYWTLEAALADLANWHRAGFVFGVSVNMATRHLQQPGFAERLAELLAVHPELPRWSLELEILETTNMADLTSAAGVIAQCIDLGVSFALDDFGTGYSSLTYFRKLPVQSLKIDQTFVRDMLYDPEDFAIVEGLVQLGHSFSRSSVAEGVEDIETAMLLKALGCKTLQGYGIARPMPAERIVPWLRSWPEKRWQHVRDSKVEKAWIPLLVAEAQHQSWTRKVLACLENGGGSRPPLDHLKCYVGQSFFQSMAAGLSDTPACARCRALHEEVHLLAEAILASLGRESAGEAPGRLAEFRNKSGALADCLRNLRLRALGLDAPALRGNECCG